MIRGRILILAITAAWFGSIQIAPVSSHEESGEWHCDSNLGIRIQVEFRPGIITIDGHADDWKDIEGSDFPLLPALDPDADKEYNDGKMTLKAVHDGKEAYFMLQINGNYAYAKGNDNSCPSVALMFQIGENASYHRMGGCEQGPDSCTNKTCHGHEVDIMHFSVGNAIPGRLYGRNPLDNREGNGGDRFGHLVDVYAWNPHCTFLDGISPLGNETSAQNDWQGSWWHSSLTDRSGFTEDDSPYTSDGQKGKYFFEFSRPLRTMDRIQQGGLGTEHVCPILTEFIVSMAKNRMLSSRLANQVNCQLHFGIPWKESLGMDLRTFRSAVTGYLWISSQVVPSLSSALRLYKLIRGMLLQPFLFSSLWCHFAFPFLSGIDFLEPAGQYTSHQWTIFSLNFNRRTIGFLSTTHTTTSLANFSQVCPFLVRLYFWLILDIIGVLDRKLFLPVITLCVVV